MRGVAAKEEAAGVLGGTPRTDDAGRGVARKPDGIKMVDHRGMLQRNNDSARPCEGRVGRLS